MTDEEKELLARIGQLAGQINRHKTQQSGNQSDSSYHAPPRRHEYRNASAPYPQRGRPYRNRTHQHRTLHLNAAGQTPPNATSAEAVDSSGSNTPRWVARNDRHRQLINANVYEKESQNRAKAIEETRKRKQTGQRHGERARFHEFLMRSQGGASKPSSSDTPVVANEISVDGIRFRVLASGKKLAKISDGINELVPTPRSAIVAGVKFHRTRTGNLVPNRIVQDHRLSGKVKKTNEPCRVFSTTGSCPKGPRCRYIHDPSKVALCKDMLKEGKCASGEACDLSHDLTPERVPNCLHFAKGNCAKAECPFTHSKAPPGAPVCRPFGMLGYCDKGGECEERHVFECPDFSNTGRCKTKGCKLLHRERASVLRAQARSDDNMDDVSSDDEGAHSDDVDSDEVAEFIDADSDMSDNEDAQEFIAV